MIHSDVCAAATRQFRIGEGGPTQHSARFTVARTVIGNVAVVQSRFNRLFTRRFISALSQATKIDSMASV